MKKTLYSTIAVAIVVAAACVACSPSLPSYPREKVTEQRHSYGTDLPDDIRH